MANKEYIIFGMTEGVMRLKPMTTTGTEQLQGLRCFQ